MNSSKTGFDLDKIKMTLVRTSEDALDFLHWLRQGHNLLGLDTETGGLSYMQNRLRLVQFGSLDEAWAIPFDRFPGLVKEALELLDRLNVPLVLHNSKFDIHFLEKNTGWSPDQTSWNRIHDTLLLAAVVDSSGSKALKDLAVHYVHPIANAGQTILHDEMKRGGWDWETVPADLDSYWIYGCVPKKTQILTKRGWLFWDKIIPEEDETLGLNEETGNTEWTKIIRVNNMGPKKVVTFGNKHWSTTCTPDHRWVMKKGKNQTIKTLPLDVGWKDSSNTKLILSAPYMGGISDITPDEASILAWVLSDGYVYWQRPKSFTSPIATIVQSPTKFADDIRNLLKREGAYVSERIMPATGCLSFYIQSKYYTDLYHKAKLNKQSIFEFVLQLSSEALQAWTQTWLDAEGDQSNQQLVAQNIGSKLDGLELSLFLSGYTTDIQSYDGKCAKVHYTKRWTTPQKTHYTDAGIDDVWCPTTELGTWTARDEDRNIYLTGNCLDTILTAHLFWILRDKAIRNGSINAYELERAAAPSIYSVERNGMLVDSDHCNQQIDSISKRNAEIESEVSQYGIENIGSSLQLIRAFQDAGIELISRTESQKQWSMNADALEEIVARTQHPLANLVSEYRHGNKMRTSYFENFLKFQCDDGRVHPQYRQVQARTGRMSATNPAIQTLPRGLTSAFVRDSFVAKEGSLFISTDFSNIEARIFASFAEEQGMLKAIRDGVDLHAYTAKEIYNLLELPSKDSAQRQIAKNVLFCLPETTKALTIDGPMNVDDLKIGDLVAGYTKDGTIDWTPIRAIHRPGNQEVITFGNDHRILRATADHRWIAEKRTDHGNCGKSWDRKILTTEEFIRGNGDHRLILSAQFNQQDRSGLTPEQCSLLGWLISDGHIKWSDCTSGKTSQSGGDKIGVRGFIAQTKKIGRWEIENLLGEFIKSQYKDQGYSIKPQSIRDIFNVTGLQRDYSNLKDIVLQMGFEQVSEFCRAVWFAEGTLNSNNIAQNAGPKYDAIRLSVFMNGYYPGRAGLMTTAYPTNKNCLRFTRGKPTMTAARVSVLDRSVEPVWCITTDFDTFVAVDGDDYFITGNCRLFGGGAAKVAWTAGVSLQEAERALEGFKTAFPGIKNFQKIMSDMARDNYLDSNKAYINLPDGRIVSLNEGDDKFYVFTNYLIQGYAASLMKKRLAVADAMGLRQYFVGVIHDEIVAEVPIEFVEDYKIAIEEAMTDDYSLSVPIVSETSKQGAERLGGAK